MRKIVGPNCKFLKPNGHVEQESSVPSVIEASGYLEVIAGMGRPGEKPKEALRRAHNQLHRWTWHRLYSIWRKSKRVRVTAEEMDELRRVAGRKRVVSNEQAELLARIERLEAALLAKDPSFYGPQIDVLKRAACGMGSED